MSNTAAQSKELAASLKLAMLEAAPGILVDYLVEISASKNPEDKRKYLELTHKIAMAAEDQRPALPTFNITIGSGLNFTVEQAPTTLDAEDIEVKLPPLLDTMKAVVVPFNAELLAEVAAEPTQPTPPNDNPLAFLDALA